MSKVKQYYADEAENKVDQILAHMKSGNIDEDKAKKEILNVDNINMLNIDAENIDEIIYWSLQ
jgi:signal transduction histidine kinase